MPRALKSYLQQWFSKIPGSLCDQLLAIDGKRLRGANFLNHITHIVELFATDDRLCLAVEKVPEVVAKLRVRRFSGLFWPILHSFLGVNINIRILTPRKECKIGSKEPENRQNLSFATTSPDKTVEKSTLPIILEQVDVEGAIISGDAHFTVPESAAQIIDAKADYLLAVKENRPTLCAEMENFFDQAHAVEWEEVPHSFHQEVDKGHGRIDIREIRVVEDLDWLPNAEKWKNLSCLVEVRSTRQKTGSAVSETFRRLYISSRRASARNFAKWTRQHWNIKNRGALKLIQRELGLGRSEAKEWAKQFLGMAHEIKVPWTFVKAGRAAKEQYSDWMSLKPDPNFPAPTFENISHKKEIQQEVQSTLSLVIEGKGSERDSEKELQQTKSIDSLSL